MNDFLSRRDLFRMSGLIAVGLTSPRWLSSIAKADLIRQATGGKRLKDTVLVVCQLSGGNDGLNTVIPTPAPSTASCGPRWESPKSRS